MGEERYTRIAELFVQVCELEHEQRAAFLDAACADDPALRVEVEALLAYDGQLDLKTGAGLQAVARLIGPKAQEDLEACPKCGGHIPSSQVECLSCRMRRTAVPPDAPRIPGYEILRLLGEGGMGRVFLARESALGRYVAIKTLIIGLASDDPAVQRFLREARVMARVEHPNVVRLYSIGEFEGRRYLVMEYVEGESLAQRLRREGRLDLQTALRIVHQTTDALAAAWERGVVHRDVKPANVLLDRREQVRVADFGLAKARPVQGDSSLTRPGYVPGTPHYVSPEQARGEKNVDFRTDVYSLGIMLFEVLAGKHPFDGATPISIMDQQIHTPLPSLLAARGDLPGEVAQLCEWMTRKQPDDRPESYDLLRRHLDTLAEGGTSAEAHGVLPAFLRPEQRTGEAPRERSEHALVGRGEELARLDRALDRALDGRTEVVLVGGEAGTGKTALISEFSHRAQQAHKELIVARGHCNAQTGHGDPYLPFREALALLTGDVEAGRASGALSWEHARRLWALVPAAAQAVADHGSDLLGTFIPSGPFLARATAHTPSPAGWRVRLEEVARRQERTPRDASLQQSWLFEQVTRTLQELARERPLLVELEDLHWSDRGSCDLLRHLVSGMTGSPVLIVGTYRPTEASVAADGLRHPFEPIVNEFKRRFGELEIRLDQEGTREFVAALLDREPNRLSAEFCESLFRQSRGHPLFTVELLRSMSERAMLVKDDAGHWVEGPSLDWNTLPARVEGAIGERIARLPQPLRAVLDGACVEGETFTVEVLSELQALDPRELVTLLSSRLDKHHCLVSAESIRRIDGRRVSTYRFGNVLFQRYLYSQLDEVQRSYLHEEVGTILERLYGAHVEQVALELARHFERAGVAPKAIVYLKQAGERAVRLSANTEAVGLFGRALDILAKQPVSPEREREELVLQLALGSPLLATAGPGSSALSRAYTRARELCGRVGDPAQSFQNLFILVHHHANKGELETALELAGQLVAVAESTGQPQPLIMAHWARGFALHYMGRFVECRVDHDRVVKLYDPGQHSTLAWFYGMDPCVSALAHNGVTYWCLGYPDQAVAQMARSITLARENGHSSCLAHAYVLATGLDVFLGDLDALERHSNELVRLSSEKGVVLFGAWGRFIGAWLRVERGDVEKGLEQMLVTQADLEATGSVLARPTTLGLLARAYLRAGRSTEASDMLATALDGMKCSGERLFEPELHRLEGELLEQGGGDEDGVEASLRQAFETARACQARSWELRAATSLAHSLAARGRSAEARPLLANAYNWFGEGHDTRDLREARALLETL